MKIYNNYVLIEEMENDNDSSLIIDLSKKDFNRGKVIEDTEVYITNDEKTILKKDEIVLYRKDRESYTYEGNKKFINFNSVICVE